MRFEDSATDFDKRVRARGKAVDTLGIDDALAIMTTFYREEPVTGLTQWFRDALRFSAGVRDRGEGEHFEVNLARVLTTARESASPQVRELELTWRFTVTPELRSMPRVEQWYASRDDLPVFEKLVRESEAFAVAQRETALSVSMLFTDATG
jgi:hypothetical protein